MTTMRNILKTIIGGLTVLAFLSWSAEAKTTSYLCYPSKAARSNFNRSTETYPVKVDKDSNLTLRSKNNNINSFIAEVTPHAKYIQDAYGIPMTATIAMAIYESNYGKSYIARNGYNFFGLKALQWSGDYVKNPKDGIRYRKFSSMREGFIGYAEFLKKPRYAEAFNQKDGVSFIKVVLQSGYCPDSFYFREIKAIINRYDLTDI